MATVLGVVELGAACVRCWLHISTRVHVLYELVVIPRVPSYLDSPPFRNYHDYR
jgi:hypothetical protein